CRDHPRLCPDPFPMKSFKIDVEGKIVVKNAPLVRLRISLPIEPIRAGPQTDECVGDDAPPLTARRLSPSERLPAIQRHRNVERLMGHFRPAEITIVHASARSIPERLGFRV